MGRHTVILRTIVFTLASLSFACLLGEFYGLWPMHWFGCWVLPPATGLLTWIACAARRHPPGASNPRTWIVQGTLGGIVAAFAYDLYRLPFVCLGAPLYKPFTRFGELLLGASEPRWLVLPLGWGYHFSNGAALGIMFLAMVTRPTRRTLLAGAIAWVIFVEVMLLLTPYTRVFGLELNATFVALTLSAHLVFGVTLGTWCRRRLRFVAA